MASDKLSFMFEPGSNGAWTDILEISAKVDGYIATQNAGSINPGIYYQVGGRGVNGRFADRLSEQLDRINADLTTGYDQVFGSGSWKTDSAYPPSDPPKLTSLVTLIDPAVQSSDKQSGVSAMVYSVGPILGIEGITDEAGYKKIYSDAISGLSSYNDYAAKEDSDIPPIAAIRITMLSCGYYADSVADKDLLFITAAKYIIESLKTAVQDRRNKSARGIKILINCNDDEGFGVERKAFADAASKMGVKVDQTGFDIALSE